MKNEHPGQENGSLLDKGKNGVKPLQPKLTSSEQAEQKGRRVNEWIKNHRPITTSIKQKGS